MKRLFPIAAGLILSLPSLASAQARGSFDRTLEVSEPVELEISTGAGSISVRPGGDGSVEIHGEIRASASREDEVRRIEANPPIEQNGNVIRIGRFEDDDRLRRVSISYELVVPSNTRLVSRTGSGSQTIGDIAGPLEVSSGSGGLDVGRIGGSVEAATGSGSITIDGVAGDLEVRSGSGSIRARAVGGAISAKSGSGGVELEQTGSGDVAVRTGSGGVEVTGVRGALEIHTGSGGIDAQGAMTGAWDLHASSGSITVELPPDAAFELDAETSSGSVDTIHPVTVSGRLSKKQLRGSVRGGGPLLAVHTSSGSIRIR